MGGGHPFPEIPDNGGPTWEQLDSFGYSYSRGWFLRRGYSESPLLLNDWIIVTPGGKGGAIAALDKVTGSVVWRSTDVTEGAHYSSALLATLGGVPQIVQFTSKNVLGIGADTGKLLWSYSRANNGTANCSMPVVFNDHVFASSAYGTGGGLVKISASEAGQKADEIYFEPKMASHHGGIVRVGDFMYGFGNGGEVARRPDVFGGIGRFSAQNSIRQTIRRCARPRPSLGGCEARGGEVAPD